MIYLSKCFAQIWSRYVGVPLWYSNAGWESFQRKLVHDTYNLTLIKDHLADLLKLATTNQLFQLNDMQVERDGFSPWTITSQYVHAFYRRKTGRELAPLILSISDAWWPLTIVPDINEAKTVLENINLAITISITNDKFTIKVAEQNTTSFVGMKITKRG